MWQHQFSQEKELASKILASGHDSFNSVNKKILFFCKFKWAISIHLTKKSIMALVWREEKTAGVKIDQAASGILFEYSTHVSQIGSCTAVNASFYS